MISRIITHFRQDSLFRNSAYLIASTLVMSGLGFVFWILAARWYTPGQIGLSSALISAASLVAGLSLLGLSSSVVRFLPTAKDGQRLFRSSLSATLLTSVCMGAMTVLLLPVVTPKLSFVAGSLWLSVAFVIAAVGLALNTLIDSCFMALRSAQFVLLRNSVLSVTKLLVAVIAVGLGAAGLFVAYGLGVLIAMAIGLVVLARLYKLRYKPQLERIILRPLVSFSLANYVVTNLGSVPAFVLPIMITTVLGAAQAGYYYVGYLIAGLLFIIPSGVANAMLAEGAQDGADRRANAMHALKLMYVILVPAVLAVCLLGPFVLSIFGGAYAVNSTIVMRVLAISSLFSALNYVGAATLNLRHQMGRLVIVHAIEAVAVLGAVWALLGHGLGGVGLGWLIGQAVMTIAYLFAVGLSLPGLRRIVRL